MGEPVKSLYKPSNPKKYQGNPNNIICRSSWERHFCRWCDLNENVLKWASEEFSIQYVFEGKVRRYYPDFLIEFRDSSGKIKKQIIEVKPKSQTQPPKPGKRSTKSYLYEAKMYEKNIAKWTAATEFALDNGVEFRIITEEDIFPEKHYNNKYKSKRRRRK